MSQFYTKDQIDQIATVVGNEIKQTKASAPTPATSYNSFILALDKAIADGTEDPSTGIVCVPTSLSFTPTVTLPGDKDRIILRFNLEVDGVSTGNGTDYNNNQSRDYQDLRINRANMDFFTSVKETNYNTPNKLADYLFLDYMGLQPTRNGYLDISPNNSLANGMPLYIGGRSYEELVQEFGNDVTKTLTKANVKLTLMLIDNLPADGVDYVLEQWGEEIVVQGCGYFEDSPFVNT